MKSMRKCLLWILAFGVFGVPIDAAAQSFQVLHAFQGGSDGGIPIGGMAFDKYGNLFGTTRYGGVGIGSGFGIVFKIDAITGHFLNLHNFLEGPPGYDGLMPYGGLFYKSGYFYGTTFIGGANSDGVVFKVGESGGGRYSHLHVFAGDTDGAAPEAGVVLDRATGNVFGTTYYGGIVGCALGCGTIFVIAQNQERVVYSFGGGNDGAHPTAPLVEDKAGNFYGTTVEGGAYGYGTVFKLNTSGRETVLHAFNYNDGGAPTSGLLVDRFGNLYGTTSGGGPNRGGTVFKLSPDGTETVLHSFSGPSDGAQPLAGLIKDASGNFYGTTVAGGNTCYPSGCGTVFKLAPDGTLTVLYKFTGASDGANPYAGLVLRKGILYGAASSGGAYGYGTIFTITE
jgi:uncharacterized repeat protein (TIGR03803 family)